MKKVPSQFQHSRNLSRLSTLISRMTCLTSYSMSSIKRARASRSFVTQYSSNSLTVKYQDLTLLPVKVVASVQRVARPRSWKLATRKSLVEVMLDQQLMHRASTQQLLGKDRASKPVAKELPKRALRTTMRKSLNSYLIKTMRKTIKMSSQNLLRMVLTPKLS